MMWVMHDKIIFHLRNTSDVEEENLLHVFMYLKKYKTSEVCLEMKFGNVPKLSEIGKKYYLSYH